MNTKQNKIEQALQSKIDELISNNGRNYKVVDVFRDNFDYFEKIISNNNSGQKSADIIAEILWDCGYRKKDGGRISPNYILKGISNVRKERNQQKYSRIKSIPRNPSSAFKKKVRSESVVVKNAENTLRKVDSPSSTSVENISETVARLQKEISTRSYSWTEKDDAFMGVLYEAYESQKDSIFLNGFWETLDSRQFDWTSQLFKTAYRLTKTKIEDMGLMDKYIDLK